jgi:2-polyprenyl-6-methoxyphenol hydroxylase-like FAD-dependent oxidoreductase
MSNSSYKVVIIGAGIAGLCLAQNLKKNDIRVDVYERNHGQTYLAEGFWIEINREGISSLRECLPSQHFATLVATSRPTNRPDCRWPRYKNVCCAGSTD